jgi:hypothetical protein
MLQKNYVNVIISMSQSRKENEASLQDADRSEDKEYVVIPLGFYK